MSPEFLSPTVQRPGSESSLLSPEPWPNASARVEGGGPEFRCWLCWIHNLPFPVHSKESEEKQRGTMGERAGTSWQTIWILALVVTSHSIHLTEPQCFRQGWQGDALESKVVNHGLKARSSHQKCLFGRKVPKTIWVNLQHLKLRIGFMKHELSAFCW